MSQIRTKKKTFKKIVKYKKIFCQNKTMRSCTKGGKKRSSLDKLGKIEGISVNTWKKTFSRHLS